MAFSAILTPFVGKFQLAVSACVYAMQVLQEMERIVLVSAKQLSKLYQAKDNVHTKHTKLNATKKRQLILKIWIDYVCNFKLEICHIFIITMNAPGYTFSTVVHSAYPQQYVSFPDATGLITFVLAGCKLNKYSIIGLVCRRVLRLGDMGFWDHNTFPGNCPLTPPLSQYSSLSGM